MGFSVLNLVNTVYSHSLQLNAVFIRRISWCGGSFPKSFWARRHGRIFIKSPHCKRPASHKTLRYHATCYTKGCAYWHCTTQSLTKHYKQTSHWPEFKFS